MTDRFPRLIQIAMKWEGSHYTDDPLDKGGPTRWGVTQRRLSQAHGRQVSKNDVRNLTKDEAIEIYRKYYWTPIRGDYIASEGVALFLLDSAINHGPGNARKFQRQSGGSLKRMIQIREEFYRDIVRRKPDQKRFIKGWLNRLKDISSISLKMTEGKPQMKYDVRWVQKALKKTGHYTGEIDGINGPKTEAAIVAFKASVGLRPRPYIGPKTLKAIANAVGRKTPPQTNQHSRIAEPWINEISRFMGLHEVRDKKAVSAWLKSDGKTLGDPTKLPWCGDAAITALVNTLPNERLPAALEENPYWARNFAKFGKSSGKNVCFGDVLVFSRRKGGHVGFAVGYDPRRNRWRVRGGNQGDMIKDSWISGDRLLAARYPSSYRGKRRPVPYMNSAGAVISRNES